MAKYRCKRKFVVDCYDADGYLIENEQKVVEEGAVYDLDESGITVICGEIHLDGEDDGSWLEVSNETFAEFFEEVN